MYDKKIDSIMGMPDVIGNMGNRKKRIVLPGFLSAFVRYTAYLLGVVLILLLVALILKTVLLSPEAEFKAMPTAGTELAASLEAPLDGTSAIFPKTAVYYHGVRLGEYEGEDITVAGVMDEFNITLNPDDVVNHDLGDSLFYGMVINIDEVRYVEDP